jgi:hypothetical protein
MEYYEKDVVKYNPQIKFERKYSVPLSKEECISYYRKKDRKTIESDFKQLLQEFEAESKENQKQMILFQKYLKYRSVFLSTRYWLICRNKKLLDDGFMCSLFKNHSNYRLHVHHNTYEHRGNDAYHLNCLMTLCDFCHEIHEAAEKQRKENGYDNVPAFVPPPIRLENFEEKADNLKKQKFTIKLEEKTKKVKKVKKRLVKRKTKKTNGHNVKMVEDKKLKVINASKPFTEPSILNQIFFGLKEVNQILLK